MDRDGIEDLIARVALRDRDAFAALYDATSAKLLGVGLRVLKDRGAAEDALQDSFIKIWHNADRFVPGPTSPMTWLIAIARNTAIDRLRARRAQASVDDTVEAMPDAAPSPEGAAVAASDLRRFSECMEELPKDRQEAIRQVYLLGGSYADCARAFDIPLNTVRTWLRRGLQSLRECLAR